MKASKMHEVRGSYNGNWIIGHKSNGSITYYADSKEDAEQTLREWDAAPILLTQLIEANKIIENLRREGSISEESIRVNMFLEDSNEAIKKATA